MNCVVATLRRCDAATPDGSVLAGGVLGKLEQKKSARSGDRARPSAVLSGKQALFCDVLWSVEINPLLCAFHRPQGEIADRKIYLSLV